MPQPSLASQNKHALLRAIRRGHVRKTGQLARDLDSPSNNWILSASVEIFRLKDPGMRLRMLQTIAPYWQLEQHSDGVKRGILEGALHAQAFECLPTMAHMGYRAAAPDNPAKPTTGRGLIATQLGQGHWPSPELLCPDLFDGEDARPELTLWAKATFQSKAKAGEAEGAGWEAAHLDRVGGLLERADMACVQQAIGMALAEAVDAPNLWMNLLMVDDIEARVVDLLSRGWLNDAEFSQAIATRVSSNPSAANRADDMRGVIERAQGTIMARDTATATGPSRARRL